MNKLLTLAICASSVAWLVNPFASARAETVDKVVVLMRHGVRPPTNDKEVAPLTDKAWPDFGVAAGMLTRHGAAAASRLGAWQGRWLTERGVLASPRCPAAGEVFAWSNRALQRTTDTGIAFLDGMFPGCGLGVGKAAGSGADPLFTASETEVGRLDPVVGRDAILAIAGADFSGPKAKLAALHSDLQRILQCCKPAICEHLPGKASCTLQELPWGIASAAGGRHLAISGPLAIAATVSQVFLLEYAQGLPADQVAWGQATDANAVLRFSEMRKIKYENFERVPYIARRGASNILVQIAQALLQGTGIDAGLKVAGPPEAKYVLYIGSDTQIAEIGGILATHWQPKSYLADETPPTGGLVFERLFDAATKTYAVRLSFVTPTLDQIRTAASFDASNPPEVLPVAIPDCAGAAANDTCPLARFGAIVHDRIDPTAVAETPYR
jgi:4-phytase / acid phosphatase